MCITGYAQAVNKHDSLALVDLYNSTNGPNWFDHPNWLTKQPVNTWYGITVTNTRVTGIFFHDNNLNGSIPPSIGNLVNLQSLFLGVNRITGSIPSSIGNLVNLTSLLLYANKLSGGIPSSIGNLVNLTTLSLRSNQLRAVFRLLLAIL
jgi:Leucine-rich repeat (LRR) protein